MEKLVNVDRANKNEPYYIKDKYYIENDRLYLSLYEPVSNVDITLVHKNYIIPFTKELKGLLIKCHDENNHPGYDETIDSIKNENYFWVSMFKDVYKYIKDCPACASKFI